MINLDTSNLIYPIKIGTAWSPDQRNHFPIVLVTEEWYNQLTRTECNSDIIFTFLHNNNQLILYHNCVQGLIVDNKMFSYAGDYRPLWSNYITTEKEMTPIVDYSHPKSIDWETPVVFSKKRKLRRHGPDTQPTSRSSDRKEETPIHNDSHECRSPVPASIYSSWVCPDVEEALVRDYWLSNLDRTICETLADNTTFIDKFLLENE